MTCAMTDFQYLLWDLPDATDEKIKNGVFLRVAFLSMKHILSKDTAGKLRGILELLYGLHHAGSSLDYLESTLRHVPSGGSQACWAADAANSTLHKNRLRRTQRDMNVGISLFSTS